VRVALSRFSRGSRFTVSFFDATNIPKQKDEPSPVIWTATFLQVNAAGTYDVTYDQERGHIRTLPVPRDEYLVMAIREIHDAGAMVLGVDRLPQACITRWPDESRVPDLVINFDGGCAAGTRVSTTSVVAKLYVPGDARPIVFQFARFYIGGTNNCAEHLSLVGALRLAKLAFEGKLHHGVRIANVAIIGDSQVALHQCLQLQTVRSTHLLALRDLEKSIRADILIAHPTCFLQLIHVHRRFNSEADAFGRIAARDRCSTDPLNIFDFDIAPWPTADGDGRESDPAGPALSAPHAAASDVMEHKSSFTVDDICYLRTFPCLEAVPIEAAVAWASIVHGQVSAVLLATTDKAMWEAFSRLLVLPCLYLPTHLCTTKLLVALAEKRPSVRKPASVDRSEADMDSRRTSRAVRYASRGFLRQAIKCFAPAAVARVDEPAVQAKLKTKVLVTDAPVYEPGERNPASTTVVDLLPPIPPLVVRKCLKEMNPVAASGLDRWNSSLLLAAIENSIGLLDLVARLLHLLLSRWRVFEEFCVLARGIALVKKEVDIRPIGIAGFFVKLLSAVCLKLDDPARILPAWQCGLAKNGCYRVIRDVRSRFADSNYVVTVDAENAFNSISRQACWDSLCKRARVLPFATAFFRLTYSSSSVIKYQHSGNEFLTLFSNVGVRQGCPLSSFIYNLATADALEAAVSSLSPRSSIFALHDDLTITSPDPAEAVAIFDSVETCLRTANLKVNRSKCELLAPTCASPDAGRGIGETRQLRHVHGSADSIRILGAHVGADHTASAFVGAKLVETGALVTKITAALGTLEPRACIALLKYCCQPKLLYCFTTHHPSITRHHAAEYRVAILAALKSFLGNDINEDLVFSSLGLSFVDYVPCLELLHKKFLENSRDLGLKADPLAELRTAHDSYVLNNHINLKARLGSQGAAAAASISWLSPFVPTSPVAQPSDVILMIRHLLLADSRSLEPCFCGTPDPGDGTFLEHMLTCSKVCGATRVFRHNCILNALDHWLRAYAVFTTIEPRFYSYADGSRKRPDLTCFSHQPPVSSDFVCSTNVDDALKDKFDKHGAAVHDLGHMFVPIAMSIWGLHHRSTDAFLKLSLCNLFPRTRTLAGLKIKRAMSEAWLIGSAAMIRGVVQRDLARAELARFGDDDVDRQWSP
jgi:ribonuclease HI